MVGKHTQAINAWLDQHAEGIQAGDIIVFTLDEYHSNSSDICGYG